MNSRMWLVSILVVLLVVAAGCSGAGQSSEPVVSPPEQPAEQPSESPSAGMRLANGLYDIDGGKAQAIGILEWVDLEGGFWAITGKPESEGDGNIAVIANSQEFQRQLEPLKGKLVNVIGKRLDTASTRMAGPEIEMESVEEMSDTPGIVE